MAQDAFAEDLQGQPLPTLFQRARAVLKQLEGVPASASATQQLVAQGSACLLAAAAAIDALALFSANEERDDLVTADIKYLLIPFYQAEVEAHTHSEDPAVRLAVLEAAGHHYRSFLRRCRQYDLLSPPVQVLAEGVLRQRQRQQGEGEDDSSSSGGGRAGRQMPMDANALRQSKIEKFKREKHIKERLKELEERQHATFSVAASPAAAAAHDDESGGCRGGRGNKDDEMERELWLLQVDMAALQAAERCGMLQQEMDILRHAASMPQEQREREREQRAAAGPPADLLCQLAAAAGNLGSAAAGAARREQLAAGVFRPSHVLPTMSVEQFGELEYHRMLEQQQRETAAKERAQRAQAERRAEDIEEEEVQKQRAWDVFKDDNPTGWGNSKLRPCS